jgi:hypothetical protein
MCTLSPIRSFRAIGRHCPIRDGLQNYRVVGSYLVDRVSVDRDVAEDFPGYRAVDECPFRRLKQLTISPEEFDAPHAIYFAL